MSGGVTELAAETTSDPVLASVVGGSQEGGAVTKGKEAWWICGAFVAEAGEKGLFVICVMDTM